jgi:hypothetical protein
MNLNMPFLDYGEFSVKLDKLPLVYIFQWYYYLLEKNIVSILICILQSWKEN